MSTRAVVLKPETNTITLLLSKLVNREYEIFVYPVLKLSDK